MRPPRSFMYGKHATMNAQEPSNPDSQVARISSSVHSSSGCGANMICALFTRMSTVPHSATTAATAASTCSRSRTSHCNARALPPSASISAAVATTPSNVRASTATFAPSFANASASPFPIPALAPVTIATLPVSTPAIAQSSSNRFRLSSEPWYSACVPSIMKSSVSTS